MDVVYIIYVTTKQIKQRYFDKVYNNAKIVRCKCGCGIKIKDKDRFGRNKFYVNGHNGRKYDDPKQYKREWNHKNRRQRYDYKNRFLRRKKSEFIIVSGGKCIKCGFEYDGKNSACFDFHHRERSKKTFGTNLACFNKYSLLRIKKEIKKCDLLCANCHRMIHSSEY